MISAFGVEHGEFSKGYSNGPYPGAKWGPTATDQQKKSTKRNYRAGLVAGGVGGGLIGVSGLKSKPGRVGAALVGGALVSHGVSTIHGMKSGTIANPYKKKAAS